MEMINKDNLRKIVRDAVLHSQRKLIQCLKVD